MHFWEKEEGCEFVNKIQSWYTCLVMSLEFQYKMPCLYGQKAYETDSDVCCPYCVKVYTYCYMYM